MEQSTHPQHDRNNIPNLFPAPGTNEKKALIHVAHPAAVSAQGKYGRGAK
jgi:hypothetical protein